MNETATATTETTTAPDILTDDRFSGSQSYSADAPESSTPAPAKTETVSDKGSEKPSTKLPASIPPPKPTGRFQERLSDLVQVRDRYKQEAQEWRERYEALTRGGQPGQKPQTHQPKPPVSDGKLKPEDFDTYDDYIEAKIEQRMEAKKGQESQSQQETAAKQYRQEKRHAFMQHAEPLAQQYEGFWDAVSDPTLPITEPMADAVMELGELAPYVMLWLASNKDQTLAMAKQSPMAAAISIGKLATRLEAELGQGGQAGGHTQTAPSAPRPTPVPSPRGTMPSGDLDGSPSDKDDVQTWLAKETARMRRTNPHMKFYGAS